jgi:hypothetical protein
MNKEKKSEPNTETTTSVSETKAEDKTPINWFTSLFVKDKTGFSQNPLPNMQLRNNKRVFMITGIVWKGDIRTRIEIVELKLDGYLDEVPVEGSFRGLEWDEFLNYMEKGLMLWL